MEILKINIPNIEEQTILTYLKSFLISKERINYLFTNELIKSGKKTLKENDIIKKGDNITINITDFEKNDFVPTEYQLDILYEDDYLLIINKPNETIIYPDSPTNNQTLANYVSYYYEQNNLDRTIRHIHRLDKNTTGCIIYAKDFITQTKLIKMVETKEVKRIYLALVKGKLPKKTGIIDLPIASDRHHNNKMIVHKNGKPALTKYHVIKYDHEKKQSLVEIELGTGRTHQIRVHFSALNHPLIGDNLYGNDEFASLKLLSWKVSFQHPITLEEIMVEVPNVNF